MKIFVSWSGRLSHKVATILRNWLPNVIQSIDAYVSSEDIDKGTRWSHEIAKELEASDFGIICVSRDNLNAPWLLFEAGALSKKFESGRVSPFLIDLKITDISGPLAQFQATPFSKEEIKKLMYSINRSADIPTLHNERLDSSFDKWWPDLEKDLTETIRTTSVDTSFQEPRSQQELLEELVRNSRTTLHMISDQQPLLRWSSIPPRLPDPVTQPIVLTRSVSSGWPGKTNLTPDQKKLLGHLYYQQAQTLDELIMHTNLPAQYVIDIIQQLSKMVSQKNQDGKYWAITFDKKWARALAEEASRERIR